MTNTADTTTCYVSDEIQKIRNEILDIARKFMLQYKQTVLELSKK